MTAELLGIRQERLRFGQEAAWECNGYSRREGGSAQGESRGTLRKEDKGRKKRKEGGGRGRRKGDVDQGGRGRKQRRGDGGKGCAWRCRERTGREGGREEGSSHVRKGLVVQSLLEPPDPLLPLPRRRFLLGLAQFLRRQALKLRGRLLHRLPAPCRQRRSKGLVCVWRPFHQEGSMEGRTRSEAQAAQGSFGGGGEMRNEGNNDRGEEARAPHRRPEGWLRMARGPAGQLRALGGETTRLRACGRLRPGPSDAKKGPGPRRPLPPPPPGALSQPLLASVLLLLPHAPPPRPPRLPALPAPRAAGRGLPVPQGPP